MIDQSINMAEPDAPAPAHENAAGIEDDLAQELNAFALNGAEAAESATDANAAGCQLSFVISLSLST